MMKDGKILCLTCVHGGLKSILDQPMAENQCYIKGVRCRIDGEPLQDRNLRTKCNQYKPDATAVAEPSPAPAKVTKDAASGTKEVVMVTYSDMADLVMTVMKQCGRITILNGGKAE